MFDGKTVTAVFVSLAVIAVLTSGQDISTPNLEGGGDFELGSLLPSGEDSSFQNRPEPNNTVEASFTADLENETLEVYNTNLTSQSLTSIESEGIKSSSPITLRSFTGSVHIVNENVTLVGEAKGYTTSGVTDTENLDLNMTYSTESIELETVKFQHTFTGTEGELISSTNTGSTADNVSFNSFTGDIVLNLESNHVDMNGLVDRLDSGSFTIN